MASSSAVPFLESLFNHIVLPPQLPGGQETTLDQIDYVLIERLLNAACTLKHLTQNDDWESLRYVLQVCKDMNSGGRLSKESVLDKFRDLNYKDLLILYIVEQNAALLIRRHKE